MFSDTILIRMRSDFHTKKVFDSYWTQIAPLWPQHGEISEGGLGWCGWVLGGGGEYGRSDYYVHSRPISKDMDQCPICHPIHVFNVNWHVFRIACMHHYMGDIFLVRYSRKWFELWQLTVMFYGICTMISEWRFAINSLSPLQFIPNSFLCRWLWHFYD